MVSIQHYAHCPKIYRSIDSGKPDRKVFKRCDNEISTPTPLHSNHHAYIIGRYTDLALNSVVPDNLIYILNNIDDIYTIVHADDILPT